MINFKSCDHRSLFVALTMKTLSLELSKAKLWLPGGQKGVLTQREAVTFG